MDCMMRISASGIIFSEGKILLVRCHDKDRSFLLGPGGGVQEGEDLYAALKREVWEETRLQVAPLKMIWVEHLSTSRYGILKFWFLGELIGGELSGRTQEALEEGISDVGWFTRESLEHEIVYPAIIKECAWEEFARPDWQVCYSRLKPMTF